MQLNVLDPDMLKDAKENPGKYPGIVVRVAGYCAYFNDLPDTVKQFNLFFDHSPCLCQNQLFFYFPRLSVNDIPEYLSACAGCFRNPAGIDILYQMQLWHSYYELVFAIDTVV